MTNPGKNRNKKARGVPPRVVAALVLGLGGLCVLGLGAVLGARALRSIWHEQCRVGDHELDVVITTGKMVHRDVVTMHFGLTNGANLAEIPFARLRENLLERVPNIRDIRIERRLPNRVTIDITEREPLVRVGLPRSRNGKTGRVADAEGVVFQFSSNTSLLPLVREPAEPATPPGRKLVGNAAAALRLVKAAALPEFSEFQILEVETTHPDHLLVTLRNYDKAMIAWDHMLEDTRLSGESLHRQLKHLTEAMSTHLAPNTTMWNATDFGKEGRIYAGPLPRLGNQ